MGIFIVMYILLFLLWIFSNSFPQKNRNTIICVICCTLLWIIQAFRGLSIGTDLASYIPFFTSSGYRGYDKDALEIGYYYLNKWIFLYVSKDPSVFLAFVSASLLIPVGLIFKRYSRIPILSFIVFASFVIYIFSFSALRQTIAIGLTTLSYICVEKKKMLPFVGLVLLASLIHSTAIIFIIVYPLCNWINMSEKKYLISCCVGGLILFSLRSVLDFVIPLIFVDKQEHYMAYYGDDVGAAYNLAILIFLFFLVTFFVKKPTKTDFNMRIIIFIGFWCQCLGLISPVAPRIGFYFFVFIGVVLANVVAEFSSVPQNRTLASIALSLFMVWFFFSKYSNGYLEVIPYKFIWE